MNWKKCRIQRYDPAVTEAPFTFITLDEFTCYRPTIDDQGETFFVILNHECSDRNLQFKFYSMSNHENFDYDVVVK